MRYSNYKETRDGNPVYVQMSPDYFDSITYQDTTANFGDPSIKDQYKDLNKYYNMLTPHERSILKLYYGEKMTQVEISKKLGYLSKTIISKTLIKIHSKLRFFIEHQYALDNYDWSELNKLLSPVEIEIIKQMMLTTSITNTVSRIRSKYPDLDLRWHNIAYRWRKIRIKMIKAASKYQSLQKYKKLLDLIEDNKGRLSIITPKQYDYVNREQG